MIFGNSIQFPIILNKFIHRIEFSFKLSVLKVERIIKIFVEKLKISFYPFKEGDNEKRRKRWTHLVCSEEQIELPRLGVHRQAAHEQGAHLEQEKEGGR